MASSKPTFVLALCVLSVSAACTRSAGIESASSKPHSNSAASQSALRNDGPRDSAAPSTTKPPSQIDDVARPIEPEVLDVQFEITQDSATDQTLWVIVPALDLRRVLGHSTAPFVCGVTASLLMPHDYEQAYPPKRTKFHCGVRSPHSGVYIIEEKLILGDQVIPVGPSAELDHRALEQPFPPVRECGAVPAETVHATIHRNKRKLKLTVPALGVDYLIDDLKWGRQHICVAEPDTDESNLIEVVCSGGEMSQLKIRLFVQRDILFFEERYEMEFDHKVLVERFGMQLPCNAQVQVSPFHPFHIPATSPCGKGCEANADACHTRCIQRGSPDECRDKCNQKEKACAELCMSRE